MFEDLRRGFAGLRANPVIDGLGGFVSALRPAWWVIRAWAVYAGVVGLLLGPSGNEAVRAIFFLALLIVSVQWGRERWHFPGLKPMIVVGNVLVVLAIPALLSVDRDDYYYEQDQYLGFPGLAQDGEPISNIFGYDAQGVPVSNLQLFDQDGNPIEVVQPEPSDWCGDEICTEYLAAVQTPWPRV
ncbi:hypothetical protein [Ornithinimicrobium sp. INDO-MA30-4]|uniref:hypothetical protein n=1 Tax=Ornithinimicrobium sp. INDO-MA30-4 TaxID=2908651 RepID=UPI001F1FE777|nr:hypothetical protein [Ornithinimicrobium sp. INDO-MA30-4]UJH70676.1 hypothetical protein L0A91_00850 [Ornithinimicrobium sp. INDO-MA30-4]